MLKYLLAGLLFFSTSETTLAQALTTPAPSLDELATELSSNRTTVQRSNFIDSKINGTYGHYKIKVFDILPSGRIISEPQKGIAFVCDAVIKDQDRVVQHVIVGMLAAINRDEVISVGGKLTVDIVGISQFIEQSNRFARKLSTTPSAVIYIDSCSASK